MTSPRPIRFDCQIDSLEEPIRGRLENGDGRSVTFCGWIEFAVAITEMAQQPGQSTQRIQSKEK